MCVSKRDKERLIERKRGIEKGGKRDIEKDRQSHIEKERHRGR